jgi:hypothetical protein
MLKRLVVGLFFGFVIGAAIAAGLVLGLGWLTWTAAWLPFAAYVIAAATGAITGLVAGKPIWARGGGIEAGLKAFFGALLAVGGMFAVRRWLHVDLDLGFAHAGSGAIGDLPAASLPLLAAVLGGFFELDNTPEAGEGGKAGAKTRVATNARVAKGEDGVGDAEADEAEPAAKKRAR